MENEVKKYLAQIGSRGGKKSRRDLDSKTAQNMVKLREAKRAFKKYYTQCFWSYDPNYQLTMDDIKWVGEELKKNGNRTLWLLGSKLCR